MNHAKGHWLAGFGGNARYSGADQASQGTKHIHHTTGAERWHCPTSGPLKANQLVCTNSGSFAETNLRSSVCLPVVGVMLVVTLCQTCKHRYSSR